MSNSITDTGGRSPAGRSGDATEKAADLVLAGSMAFLAGATDIYGLARLGDLFVSFMSGNTTQLGKALGRGELARSGTTAGIIAVFVLGAAAGAAVAERVGQYRTPAVLGMVTVILSAAWGWPEARTPMLILAMGALNAALSHVGSASVGLTYVTGSLVKFGQGIGTLLARPGTGGDSGDGSGDGAGGGSGGAISGQSRDWSWTLQGVMWLCLLAGVVAATMASARLGASPWPLPLLAALVTAAAIVRR